MTLSLWPSDDETIEGSGRALREGRITCVGLVNRCLAAIDEWEPKVKAWYELQLDDGEKRFMFIPRGAQ